MILTVLKVSWLNLKRDRLALALTFLLPIVFFSIFAAVFGGMDGETTREIATALVLEDETELGRAFRDALAAQPQLRLVPLPEGAGADDARDLVATGAATAAVIVPRGFGGALTAGRADATLLADRAHPIAAQVIAGLLRASAFEVGYGAGAAREPLTVAVKDVFGDGGKRPSIAYFAAGIGVMFLLFSLAGRSAILIDERESGVLERLLTTRLSLAQLLAGRWLFLAAVGVAQVTAMFVWGSIAFGLDLWTPRHLAGFAVLTTVAAAAAAAFALLLAAACRTRVQLHGVSTVLVLIMSALGGSMFPRFLMPESLQKLGKLTFNAWALDGYQKVFWYELPLARLAPEIAVLAALTALLLAASWRLARRWERI